MSEHDEIQNETGPEEAAAPLAPPPPRPVYPGHHAAEPVGGHYKSPMLAAVLSFMPGLGNIYNGLYLRGVAFFLAFVGLISLVVSVTGGDAPESEIAFLAPSIAFLFFFNVFDAFRQATLINSGQSTDLGIADRPQVGGGALVPGVMLMVVGTYGLMLRFFDFDLTWLVRQWPYLLLVFGGFLVFQSLKARRQADAAAATDY